MADAAGEDKEMEDGVHESFFIDDVEHGSGYVSFSLVENPYLVGSAHAVEQRLEGDEYREPHQAEADGLEVGVVFQFDETGDGAGDGCSPDKREQAPSPVALFAQGNERDGRIRTRNVPVDGGMVPLAQPLFPHASCLDGMIDGGGEIRHEHAEEIENDAGGRPSVARAEAPYQKNHAEDHAQGNASAVARRIPNLFFVVEMNAAHLLFLLVFLAGLDNLVVVLRHRQ